VFKCRNCGFMKIFCFRVRKKNQKKVFSALCHNRSDYSLKHMAQMQHKYVLQNVWSGLDKYISHRDLRCTLSTKKVNFGSNHFHCQIRPNHNPLPLCHCQSHPFHQLHPRWSRLHRPLHLSPNSFAHACC
jgi:hypothetical protein